MKALTYVSFIVDNKGGVKISDFGISKKVEEGKLPLINMLHLWPVSYVWPRYHASFIGSTSTKFARLNILVCMKEIQRENSIAYLI